MEKSTLQSLTDRLRSTSTQMGRTLTQTATQLKDFLQPATPESRLVDQATSPSLVGGPDWGLNLRICSLLNSNHLSGPDLVRAIKRKITANSAGGDEARVAQLRLAMELLEACAMNCEKVFSEIAAERVVEELVERVVENGDADRECQVRGLELVRAWGESEELSYLPVFRQVYENLQRRVMSSEVEDGALPPVQYSLESYIDQNPVPPPESYPIPGTETDGASDGNLPFQYGSLSLSAEEKKEFLEITKNSVEVLSSLLGSASDSKVVEDDLTITMLDKCKESQPMLQRIVESMSEDEGLLFEALNLNDELQKVISKFEEMQVFTEANVQQSEERKDSSDVIVQSPPEAEALDVSKSAELPKGENAETDAADDLSMDSVQSPPLTEALEVNKSAEPPKEENAKTDAADDFSIDAVHSPPPAEALEVNESAEPLKGENTKTDAADDFSIDAESSSSKK